MANKFMERLGFGKESNISILSPLEGEACLINEVNDPTFSEKILGDGIAVRPSKGRVVAPVNGTVSMLFETKHAVSILSDQGTEILIHVGIDTVNLKGEYFKSHVKAGDRVKAGDLLTEFDIMAITQKGYDLITPIVICNTSKYSDFVHYPGNVKELDKILEIKK
jgi:PTS system beta-glucosides-specific IIC component